MKLHVRLALPLFAFAIGVSLAGIGGVIVLARRTASAAVDQHQRQFARIVTHQLAARARDLSEIAAILASLDGSARARSAAWSHAPLDAVLIVDRASGRVESVLGASPNPADLAAVLRGSAPSPLLLEDRAGLLVAAASPERGHRRMAIAAQRLGPDFAGALKELLQGEVALHVGGRSVAATAAALPSAPGWFRIEIPLRAAGPADAGLTVFVPAAEFQAARRAALQQAVLGGLLLLGAAALFYRYTLTRVTRPIADLIAATDRIAAGAPEAGLPPDAPAELGALVRQFNAMATTLRDTQDKLIHSAKLSSVGQLVASVSHELNNPLSGLLSHAEYLAGRMEPGAPGRAEVDVILAEGGRMKRILADLRGIVRPGASERVRVDLNAVVGDVLALIRHDAVRARVACEPVLAPGAVPVLASPDQIRQVVLNLALNALQAMPEGGTLRIETTTGDGTPPVARLTLEDTGTGIAPEHLARIMEPFFSTKPGRLGLGLAIVRDAAAKHDGRLEFRPRPGGGTRAIFELPGVPA